MTHEDQTQTITGLTVGGGRLGPVQRADDDEAEALALLPVDDDVTGLSAGSGRPVRRGRGAHAGVGRRVGAGAVAVREVAARGAVLRGHRAGAAAVLRTRLTWRGGGGISNVVGYENYYNCAEHNVQISLVYQK